MRRHQCTRVGFTLVELLVVVGIIVVLIAILLPVLSKAREHALRAKCAANLRSIGQALTMYTQQFGYFPAGRVTTGSSNFAIWPTRLRPFAGGDERIFYCQAQDERCEWRPDDPTPGPRAREFESQFGYEIGERLLMDDHVNRRHLFSYGYNGLGSAGGIGVLRDGSHKGLGFHIVIGGIFFHPGSGELKANRVRSPSQMIAVADAMADGGSDYYIAPRAGVAGAFPAAIHSGGANVLFCDGHVQWHRQKELILPPDPTDTEQSYRWSAIARIWNNDNKGLWD